MRNSSSIIRHASGMSLEGGPMLVQVDVGRLARPLAEARQHLRALVVGVPCLGSSHAVLSAVACCSAETVRSGRSRLHRAFLPLVHLLFGIARAIIGLRRALLHAIGTRRATRTLTSAGATRAAESSSACDSMHAATRSRRTRQPARRRHRGDSCRRTPAAVQPGGHWKEPLFAATLATRWRSIARPSMVAAAARARSVGRSVGRRAESAGGTGAGSDVSAD